MSTVILSESAGNGVLTVDGVTALTAKSTGVIEAGAPGVSGNDVAVVSQLGSLGLGVGQTWQDVTGSRAFGTPYTNSTGKPIMVSIFPVAAASKTYTLTVGGVQVSNLAFGSASVSAQLSAIVPDGATYTATTNSGSLSTWAELR